MVPFLIKSDPFSSIYPHQGRKSRLTKGERLYWSPVCLWVTWFMNNEK